MLKRIFWNQEEMRIRAFWRFLAQFVFTILLLNVFGLLMRQLGLAIYGTLPNSMAEDPIGLTLFIIMDEIVASGLMIFSIWACGRFLDRRHFTDFGMRINNKWLKDLAFGLFLGGFLMTLIFMFELAAGWITISGFFSAPHLPDNNFIVGMLPKVVIFLGVGIREKLLSRGYQLTNLAEGFANTRLGKKNALLLATLITSLIFGLLHTANPNATAFSTANIMIGGIFLAMGYLLTGELGLSIGLHITWNFFQTAVFGFPVSGMKAHPATFITIEQGGINWVTGGPFGPEGGLIGLAAIFLGLALIALWVRLRTGELKLATQITEPDLLPIKEEGISPESVLSQI